MSSKNISFIILLLMLMTCVAPLSMDIYLPSLVVIMNDFSATYENAQLSLGLFIIGLGISQLIYGPLSDKFGRIPILYFGLFIYMGATIICALSPSMGILNAARFLQGIGACGAAVTSTAIARDLFEGKESIKIFAKMATAIGCVPVLAPILGTYFQQVFGWRSNFIFLLLFSLTLLSVSYLNLKETNINPDRKATHPKKLIQNYWHLLSHRKYLIYSCCSMLTFGALFSYVSNSPYYLISLAGTSIEFFSVLFSLNALGFISGAFITSKLSHKLSTDHLIAIGGLLLFAGGVLQAVMFCIFSINPFSIMMPMLICTFGIAMMMPSTMAASLAPFPEMAGSASALGGFIRFLGAAFIGALVGYIQTSQFLALPIEMIISGAGVIFLIRLKSRASQAM
ncbi:MAG: multidrug effflux MFS transporter [Gammaproteobacteria bacterium]